MDSGWWSWTADQTAQAASGLVIARQAVNHGELAAVGMKREMLKSIEQLAEQNPRALCHPLVFGAVLPSAIVHRELSMLVQLGVEVDVELSADSVLLCSNGNLRTVERGHHTVADLREVADKCGGGPIVDAFGWALAEPSVGLCGESEAPRAVSVVRRALQLLAACLPEAFDWVVEHARWIVPLDGQSPVLRSSSCGSMPGLVLVDTVDELTCIELLVHEAAHHVVYAAESAGPLVEGTDEPRFISPLRPDLRPLRGIILAAHALTYICEVQALVISATGFDDRSRDLDDLRVRRDEAVHMLQEAADDLSNSGRDFVIRLQRLHDHAA